VLFSNDQLVKFIHESFEPVWESVRPVPTLTLDFGNGKTITRTLHGNIASYVCTAEGQVLDILPGMYSTEAYLNQLNQMWLLHAYLLKKEPAEREKALREYHQTQADALAKNILPGQFIEMDMSKLRIERSAKKIMVRFLPPKSAPSAPITTPSNPAPTTNKTEKADAGKGVIERPAKKVLATSNASDSSSNADDVAQWQELGEDTLINEHSRRLQIHHQLAKIGSPQPAAITKWLYAEVLHADLDDPYLGLGSLLNGSYPFKK
jgi:hypothetical protein